MNTPELSKELVSVLSRFDRYLFRYGVQKLALGAAVPTVREWLEKNGLADVVEGIGEETALMVWNSVTADPQHEGEWIHEDLAFTSQRILRPVLRNVIGARGSITVASVEIVERGELVVYERRIPGFAEDIAQELDCLLWRVEQTSKTADIFLNMR
jgi:hypothetical protein